MITNALSRRCGPTIAVMVSAVFCCVSFSSASAQRGGEKRSINVYWTDRGVGQWNENLTMFDDFDKLENRGVTDVRHAGQILIPMPADKNLPLTNEGWQSLSDKIYLGLRARVERGIKAGDSAFEILEVENISLKQHVWETLAGTPSAKLRQASVDKFTETIGYALHRLKEDLSTDATVDLKAIGASNGARTLINTVPKLAKAGKNPVNDVILVDSRGGVGQTDRTIDAVGEKHVRIIITQLDAPAPSRTVANSEAARLLKLARPGIEVYWVTPESESTFPYPGIHHIISTKKNSPPLMVKKLTKDGYMGAKEMSHNELLFGQSSPPSPASTTGSDRSQRSQEISARETSARPTQDSSGSNAVVDPSSLSPEEREGRRKNEAIIARETLGQPTEPLPSSSSSPRLDPILWDAWHDEGDRAFKNKAEEDLFYKTYPQLEKYRNIARYSSPATEVDRDVASGTLSREPMDQSNFMSDRGQRASTSNGTFDPSSLSPEERKAKARNEAIVARETLVRSTQDSAGARASGTEKTATSNMDFDPNTLSPEEREARRRNEATVARETRARSAQDSAGGSASGNQRTTTSNTDFDPARLSTEERENRLRNEGIVARETFSRPVQQQVQDWAERTFPQIEGPGSPGISFGDVSRHTAPDGLKAVPKIEGELRSNSTNRFFTKSWTVYAGDQVIGEGFSDVKLLGGGLFAAKKDPLGWGTYKLYSSATGKPISSTEFSEAQSLGAGLVAILPPRETTWQIKDDSGQTVGTFNGGGHATYIGKGQVQVDYAFGNPQFVDVSKATSLQHQPALQATQGAPTTAPSTGGVYLGGPQTYKETKSVDSQFDRELNNAEPIPKKKKP